MRVSTSKYEVIVLFWKTMECFLWAGAESLPQAKFKYLFTSDGKMEM